MSFKQTVENNIIVFFLGTLALGFATGWGAFSAIQFATGQTSISIDRLKQLEGPEAQDKRALLNRVQELELERLALQQALQTNRPTTGNYVRNVVISPASPAELKVGEQITVKFDYVLTGGERANVWAIGDGPTTYSGSSELTGSGTAERHITGQRPGKVTSVRLSMSGKDGHELYEMQIPVEFTFRR